MHRTYLGDHRIVDDWHHLEELRLAQDIGRIFELDPPENDALVLQRYDRNMMLRFGVDSSRIEAFYPYAPDTHILMGYLVRTIRSGMLVRPIFLVHPISQERTRGSSIKERMLYTMKDTLLKTSWAGYVEEWRGKPENWDKRHPQQWTGREIALPPDIPEDVHSSATATARYLYDAIEVRWGVALGRDINLASFMYRTMLSGRTVQMAVEAVDEWAHYATMTGMGEGVAWEDSHDTITTVGRNQEQVELSIQGMHLGIEEPIWYEEES